MDGVPCMSVAPKLTLVATNSVSEGQLCDAQALEDVGLSTVPSLVKISEHLFCSLPKEIQKVLSEKYGGVVTESHAQAIRQVLLVQAKEMSKTDLRQSYKLTYKNWDDMKQRCKPCLDHEEFVPELHPLFERFVDFLAIMGPRPYDPWSLDRIDTHGPYSPNNLQWADKKTQSRNRTNTIYLTDSNGVRRPLVEWAEILGISPSTLRRRRAAGWSDVEVLSGQRILNNPTLGKAVRRMQGDPFIFTPWPYDKREKLERLYQRHARENEHRLAFMKRYAVKMMSATSEAASNLCWPEEYEPSEEELALSTKLGLSYQYWSELYLTAQKKLAGKAYLSFPYGQLHLPDWVENALSARFGAF